MKQKKLGARSQPFDVTLRTPAGDTKVRAMAWPAPRGVQLGASKPLAFKVRIPGVSMFKRVWVNEGSEPYVEMHGERWPVEGLPVEGLPVKGVADGR